MAKFSESCAILYSLALELNTVYLSPVVLIRFYRENRQNFAAIDLVRIICGRERTVQASSEMFVWPAD
jgi:hypothetical protein